MTVPLRIQLDTGRGKVTVRLTDRGLSLMGSCRPRLDLVINLWDALVHALALEEINLETQLGKKGAARRVAEARAALQVRLARR